MDSDLNKRINYNSGTKWEKVYSYSRAVKAGNLVFVSGTTAVDENGTVYGAGNISAQTEYILNKIEASLEQYEAGMNDIVRVRIFIIDISLWKEASKAFSKKFKNINPAATLVEIQNLIEPDLLIEIEVDAVILNERGVEQK